MKRTIRNLSLAVTLGLGVTTAAAAYINMNRASHTVNLGTIYVTPADAAPSDAVSLGGAQVKAKGTGPRLAAGQSSSDPVFLGTIEVKPSRAEREGLVAGNLGKNHGRVSPVAVLKYLSDLVFARAGG